ncbi:MAG: DUF6549 family protein, partial [Phocaeicola sp.]
MNKLTIWLLVALIGMGAVVGWQYKRIGQITDERNQYQQNTYSLLSDIEELRADSSLQAHQVQTLFLSLEEYKKYRTADAQTITDLKLKLKQVSAVAKQELEVNVPISTPVKDSVVVSNDMPDTIQTISYKDQYVTFDGTIQHDSLTAQFHVPVTISQVLYKVPKHKFLWWSWGCKAIKQV